VANALASAREDHDPVGVFGYSFGARMALLAAADAEPQPATLSVVAPPAATGREFDPVTALGELACPVQVIYGERDTTVNWEPVVERAREREDTVSSIPGDHFFVGQVERIAGRVSEFLAAELRR